MDHRPHEIARTARLSLRRLTEADAAFFNHIVNQRSWLANIGDRKVRSDADAVAYIRDKTIPGYAQHGFGMYVAQRHDGGGPVGLCGLVRRDALPGPDLGFALLEDQWGRGYAREAAQAVVEHAFGALGIAELLAITLPTNARSIALLGKLGFAPRGTVRITTDELRLYALPAPRPQ